MFQFKTFALNHGRFMKDQIFAEAAAGNLKPLATVLSIYPIAGELVGDVRSIAKLKPRDESGIERVVHNYTMVGGLGLITDVYTSAQWGGLASTLMGPSITDMLDLGERMLQGDVQGVVRDIASQPTIQLATTITLGGAYFAEKAFESDDFVGEGLRSGADLLFKK